VATVAAARAKREAVKRIVKIRIGIEPLKVWVVEGLWLR